MTDNKKHILLVTSEFPPQPGGIGNHAYLLVKHLEVNGFEVEVIADQRSVSGEEEASFDNVLKFKVHRVAMHKLRLLMYIKRLILLFRNIKSSDIVIASGKFSLWIVAFASLFYKRRYIAVIHGSEVNFTNKGLKTAVDMSLKRFSRLVAVSNYTKNLVKDIHNDIVVIPNGIDANTFNGSSAVEIYLDGSPKLITVGNVTDRKGQLNVIKHLPELIKAYPDLHYHCVGLPTQKDEFIDIARALEVDDYITFYGRVTDNELQGFLAFSDIFVMLSSPTETGDVEGFGIALIEANYFGLPCIGATGCGIEDAIDDYKTGRLIAPDSVVEFETAMADILSDYNSYRDNSKAWALQHSWTSIIKQYIDVLES